MEKLRRTLVGRGNLASRDHVRLAEYVALWGVASVYNTMSLPLPARLQAASSEYQKFQVDLSNAVEARQRLDAQLSENELVKKVREPQLFFFGSQLLSLLDDRGHRRSLTH